MDKTIQFIFIKFYNIFNFVNFASIHTFCVTDFKKYNFAIIRSNCQSGNKISEQKK